MKTPTPAVLLAAAFCTALGACNVDRSGTPPEPSATTAAVTSVPTPPPAVDDAAHTNQLAQRISETLQACSYDGAPVRVQPGGEAPRDCGDMIARVMDVTGLPQNFAVVEADVPNAAAVILLDQNKVPRRVIAFNGNFIELVRRHTGGNLWSPVSVMAHEVGHHLAGHTIMPGGSQPPIELEADKCSGFVLYKMGAGLEDATAALKALVSDRPPTGSTHPGRSERVAAVSEGWVQACRQSRREDCAAGLAKSAAASPRSTAVAAVDPAPPTASPAPTSRPEPAREPAPVAAPVAANGIAQLPAQTAPLAPPAPSRSAIPSKGMQFIYDEYGLLDRAIVEQHERQLREHASQSGVEIVTVLVRDLHGMDAETYAWTMLRQLRVGKLDVGNGAVLVVAPDANQAGIAMGPGVALEMASHDKVASLQRWIQTAWPLCQRARACGNWTDNLMGAADHIRRDTRHWDWSIRYQDLASLQQQVATEQDTAVAPQDSQAWRKIVSFTGTVEDLAPKAGDRSAFVNEAKLDGGRYKAIRARDASGMTVMLYLDPRTQALMPGGALRAGQRYAFIGREAGVSRNPHDTQPIDLLSYVQMQ